MCKVTGSVRVRVIERIRVMVRVMVRVRVRGYGNYKG